MAKQMVNPIERHVEKLVVGIAALILVGAVALYLVSSPNKVEMGGEQVTPKTVDAAVAERAAHILSDIRSTEAKVTTPDPLADDFAASLAPLEPVKLALGAPVGPPVPLIDPPITVGGKVRLVKVVRPEKTGITSGRSTIKARDGKFTPINWATVSTLFDYKQQVEVQKQRYGAKWDQVVVISPEIQRRAQRPDGSWSDEDWVDITPHPGWPLQEPKIEFEERRGGLSPTSASLTEYNNFMRALDDLKNQLELLRPLMYVPVNGDNWKFPVLTSYADVVKQDQDYLNPDGTSSPTDRYGLEAAPVAARPTAVDKDPVDAELDAIRDMLDRAKKDQVLDLAIGAFNKSLDISNSAAASAIQKQRALKLKEEADLLEKDISRRIKLEGDRKPVPGREAVAVVRQRQPIQQVWAHDAAEESLQDGHTYQYRIRCRILNALAADPIKFENPEDAAKVVVASDWSEPTEPITFEPSSLFFATYEDRSKKLVGIEFFRWYYGVWLKSRRANLGVGERIATAHRTDVPGLEDPAVKESAEVEWSSNGKERADVIVDIDLEREMLERKTARGSEGVSFGPPKKETSLVYMDAEGRLHEKFVALDKDHPEKREASGRVWTPKP